MFQGGKSLLIVSQSTFEDPTININPQTMQWLTLTLVLAIMASCCDTSDLSRALGAVLDEEDTMMGEENIFLFQLIIVLLIKHKLKL